MTKRGWGGGIGLRTLKERRLHKICLTNVILQYELIINHRLRKLGVFVHILQNRYKNEKVYNTQVGTITRKVYFFKAVSKRRVLRR
jgi:hypothetical protein